MLGNIVLYLANRAASGAAGSVSRWASWGAAAALFLASALVFALVALYWWLETQYGPIRAAGIVASGAAMAGVICLSAPAIMDAMERRAMAREREKVGPVGVTVEAVNKETEAAIDYFGPLQVLASAFLVGLSTGRKLRGT
jgi:uncharacterized membrane protein YedE/YeeE